MTYAGTGDIAKGNLEKLYDDPSSGRRSCRDARRLAGLAPLVPDLVCHRSPQRENVISIAVGISVCIGIRVSDTDADADADADGDGGDGLEVFVVNELLFGDEDTGFDIDGVDSPAGCADDFCRDGPTDGVGGVDNRLGPVFDSLAAFVPGFDINMLFEAAILSGNLIILIRMIDVDDWTDDDSVVAYLYTGHDPSAVPSAVEGRTYQVNASSLVDGIDIDNPVSFFGDDGVIAGGVYQGGPSSFQLLLPLGSPDGLSKVPIDGAYISCDASLTGLDNGIIGGAIMLHMLYDAVRQVPAVVDFIAMMPAILESQADIDSIPGGTEIAGTRCTPANVASYDIDGNGCGSASYTCSAAGLCVEPTEHYDSISVGMTFSAVPAFIDGIYID